jgi:hypothetical protein
MSSKKPVLQYDEAHFFGQENPRGRCVAVKLKGATVWSITHPVTSYNESTEIFQTKHLVFVPAGPDS